MKTSISLMWFVIVALMVFAVEGVSHGASFDPSNRGCVKYGKAGQSRKGKTPWNTEKLSNGALPAITAKGAI